MKAWLAEFVGTFWLVLGDCVSAALGGARHRGSAVVFFTRSSTKLVLQSSTLGWRSSVSITKRE